MIKEELNNMETTLEGAQKRITKVIDSLTDFNVANDLEYIAVFLDTVGDEMAAMSSAYSSMNDRFVQALAAIDEWKDNFEAVSTASARRLEEKIELQKRINSLQDEIDGLQDEIIRLRAQAKIDKATINASLSSIHAANDNR